jgi:glycosyltransferase involved in cell wall biosynthesis
MLEVNRLHVALISHEYPPFIYGGVATFVENLAHGLLRRGVDVTVLAGYPFPSSGIKKFRADKERTDSGINVVRFPYPNAPPRQLWFQVFNISKLSETVRRIGADVIHGQSGVAFPALIALKDIAPTVVSFHSDPRTELVLSLHSITKGGSFSDIRTYAIGYPISMYCFRKEFEMSKASIAVSESLMNCLLLDVGNGNQKKMRYIYNGVNVQEITKEYSNANSEKERDTPIIFSAGRLYWRKGVLNLVKLAHLLEKKHHLKHRILVHGSGPLRAKMEAQIRKYGLTNITIKGFTQRAEFLRDLKRASYVVIPSMFEACPMLLLESMCLGKIPIMFDLPYSEELTKQGEYGILVHNVEEMAQKIESFPIETDVETCENKIKHFAVKQYHVSKTAAQYHELYRSIC